MSIVHQNEKNGTEIYACAQGGCRICQDALVRKNTGLIHVILHRQRYGGVEYEELVQAGRIGVWQASLHFDPHRGVAFSTYAGTAIRRSIWRAIDYANRPYHHLLPDPIDLREKAEENVWQSEMLTALLETVACLPERLRQVIIAAYGLDGKPPRSLAAIGRHYGVSREMARYWRNDALVLLRLPVLSERLRQICDQNTRSSYVRTQALSRVWTGRWRR